MTYDEMYEIAKSLECIATAIIEIEESMPITHCYDELCNLNNTPHNQNKLLEKLIEIMENR